MTTCRINGTPNEELLEVRRQADIFVHELEKTRHLSDLERSFAKDCYTIGHLDGQRRKADEIHAQSRASHS